MNFKHLRLLDTGSLSAAENMALDKVILDGVADGSSPPTFRFLQFKPPAALLGFYQDLRLEVRSDFCLENGIDVNRRITGGGSLLFQESALGWEVFSNLGAAPFPGSLEKILTITCNTAAKAISKLGVQASFRPRNDIEVNGRKISGTGGTSLYDAFMFQGTLLVENEIELFLRALRVPVEKLKKREIESLMDRICFLSDILPSCPSVSEIKSVFVETFSDQLGIKMVPGSLTEIEESRLADELAYFQDSSWIDMRRRPEQESIPFRSISQTSAGTIRVHLWPSPGGRRIKSALISGDFFSSPARFVNDIESALIGMLLDPETLLKSTLDFLKSQQGILPGITHEQVAQAIADAAERTYLLDCGFSGYEVNELFFINSTPLQFGKHRAKWLLLPYCSKDLKCKYRKIPGCDECGECHISDGYGLAKAFNLTPYTIQSFEHLMGVLKADCSGSDGIYLGSCCEAFYAKHQSEMRDITAKGILVNLDSTTCYDLGKGSNAYRGDFDNQTQLNIDLIEKTLRLLDAASKV